MMTRLSCICPFQNLVSIGNEEDDDKEETLSVEGAGLSLECIRL